MLAALNTDPTEGSAALAARIIRETLHARRQGVPSADRARRPEPRADRAGARAFSTRATPRCASASGCARSALADGKVAGARFRRRDACALDARRSRRSSRFRRWSRRRVRAGPAGADRVPRHRECAFPPRSAGRPSADDRRAQRDHRVAVLAIRAGSRPRPAAPTGCSTSRARSSPRRSGARSRRSPACRPTCRPGRSCASAARPSRRRRRKTPGAPAPPRQFSNLYLAGDWTDTGLPATIEGAIRSGNRAADLALRMIPK